MSFVRNPAEKPTFLEKLEARREAKYLKRIKQMSGWHARWRNQASRRKLVIAHEAGLLVMLLSGIALIGALTGALPGLLAIVWSLATLVMIVVWTSLNITVDMIDSAPISLLDEYQQDQLLNLRGFTYRCFNYFGIVLCVALVFVGTYVMNYEPDWGRYVPYGFGIFGTVVFLFLATLPTVVYAWNLPDE